MMATAIPVAIKPYSMAVAARSSLRKAMMRIMGKLHGAVCRETLPAPTLANLTAQSLPDP
jgi:hypothetical protein